MRAVTAAVWPPCGVRRLPDGTSQISIALALTDQASSCPSGRYCRPATFPTGCTTTAGPADNFLAKLNKTGSTLLYSSFLGGSAAGGAMEYGPMKVAGLGFRRNATLASPAWRASS